MSEQKIKTPIEDLTSNETKIALSSPRSIKACRLLGVMPSELQFISFEQFKLNYPGLLYLSKEMLQYRYKRFNRFRNETIQKVKQQREQLLKVTNNQSCESLQKSVDTVYPNALEIVCDSFIDKERKSLNNVKSRQRAELRATLEKEAKIEQMRNYSSEKEKKHIERVENDSHSNVIEHQKKDRSKKKLQEHYQPLDMLKKGDNELLLNNNDPNEMEMTHKGSQSTRNNDNYFERRAMKAEARRIFHENKERHRKEKSEKKRIEKLLSSERHRIEVDKRLCQTRTANDINRQQIQSQIRAKQQNNERKLEKCLSLRDLSIKKRQEQEAAKYQNILNALRKANDDEEKRHQMINEKGEKIDQLVSLKEAKKRLEIISRSQNLHNLIINALNARTELEKEKERKKIGISNKIEDMHKRHEEVTKVKERENSYKREDSSLLRFEKELQIQRLNRMKDYQSQEKDHTLVEKRKKIEEYKQQQIKLLKSKKKEVYSISKEKNDLIDKFEDMMYKSKKINMKTLKQFFPNDKDLQLIAKEIKEQKDTDGNRAKTHRLFNQTGTLALRSNCFFINNNNNYYRSPRSSGPFTNRSKDNERLDDMLSNSADEKKWDKVVEYHQRLLHEVNKVIEEEKVAEKKRIIKYEQEQSIEKRKVLEKEMHKEREKAKNLIISLQNLIESKVEAYKNKLDECCE